MKDFIHINKKDNVIVALKDLPKGKNLCEDEWNITLLSDIPKGHKISIKQLAAGENIIKYGYPIGKSTKNIHSGSHVHINNLKTNLAGTINYSYEPTTVTMDKKVENKTFNGYKRFNSKVGIRNELWIIPTVGCVNGTAELIVNTFKKNYDTLLIDDICIWKHPFGCSQLGQDHKNTANILRDLAVHPNAGGVLVLGLGCENNTIEEFKKNLLPHDNKRIKFLTIQEVEDEIEEGVSLLEELYETMKQDKRMPMPISNLTIGLKCGGSDGLSGITANPLVGELSDYLVANGGTTVLTEVPEMFGAETILMNRTVNKETFDDMVNLINGYKEYYLSFDQPIYENPSPGNKAGGISTLEDKSLGCIQKGGNAPITDVLDYGDIIKSSGLNILSAPGNDLVATTALGSSGCQMVIFTTGRGTPFGSFIPTIKISTNSELYNKKPHWIDFNAGNLIDDRTMEDSLEDLIDYIIDVASGKKVNNEKNYFKEISIFKTGVTL
ncbi:UxaA family hydrolase [Vallitalea guaymasensis]|uniref:UxaA family hydrolase n=1 Tax=Vallitalea guaymasensis TaxID=1185412 RepID=UPI002354E892|nr:altronate dehydratase family protein [Vallitalea guaymasensis]